MVSGETKQATEESKAPIFSSGKYKIGTDHSAWNRAYARGIALGLGIRNEEISDAAVDHLMSNVAAAVRDVIMTAAHFSTHGRRTKVETCDVDNAINVIGLMVPFTSSHAPSNTQFCHSDVLPRSVYPNSRYVVDLRSIMNMPPRRMPFKRRMRKHWLVIEGEQPRVPENPIVTPSTSGSMQEGVSGNQNSSTDSFTEDGNRVHRGGNKAEQTVSRPFTTHLLPVDQQVFFKKCVETVMGSCSEKRREVLHLLASDPGLQSLVPRFALIIFEGVRCNIAQQNLPILRNILRLVKTLTDNPQVNLDKCLNDIIPSLCSCVVCCELCADLEDRRHFRLREFAAIILATICKRTHLADVRARVTTFLCRVFTDPRANLTSFYGALYALGELGCETVAVVVFPRLELLRRRIAMLKDSSPAASADSEKVTRLIEKMLTRFVTRRKLPGLNKLFDFEKVFPGFGETVYNKLNSGGQDVYQKSSGDFEPIPASGRVQSLAQKRSSRIPQLPLRAPGIVRPIHVSVAKLRMFKHTRRYAGSGLFRKGPQPAESRAAQPSSEGVQQSTGPQTIKQNPSTVPQNIRGPSTQTTGPLPAVVVEPAFPRRRPPVLAEPPKAHPAVTVEPAYPRRPGQSGPLP